MPQTARCPDCGSQDFSWSVTGIARGQIELTDGEFFTTVVEQPVEVEQSRTEEGVFCQVCRERWLPTELDVDDEQETLSNNT